MSCFWIEQHVLHLLRSQDRVYVYLVYYSRSAPLRVWGIWGTKFLNYNYHNFQHEIL
nr:hypothetical protein [Cressdnaviricota sp.]